MARKFKLEKVNPYGNIKEKSGSALHVEYKMYQQKLDNTIEKGKDFIEDKNKLELAKERIEKSSISNDDKRVILSVLKESIEKLDEQYMEDIAKNMEKYEQEIEAITKMVEDYVSSIEKQIVDLKETKLVSGVVSTEKAEKAAEDKKQELNDYVKTQKEQLQLRIDQKNMMERQMLRKKFLEIGK